MEARPLVFPSPSWPSTSPEYTTCRLSLDHLLLTFSIPRPDKTCHRRKKGKEAKDSPKKSKKRRQRMFFKEPSNKPPCASPYSFLSSGLPFLHFFVLDRTQHRHVHHSDKTYRGPAYDPFSTHLSISLLSFLTSFNSPFVASHKLSNRTTAGSYILRERSDARPVLIALGLLVLGSRWCLSA